MIWQTLREASQRGVEEVAKVLVDTPSVSDEETPLADAIESFLKELTHLKTYRVGDTVVARSELGKEKRIILAGHTDTVPISLNTHNVPGRIENRDGKQVLWGRGSVDMKSGLAVFLQLAATLTNPRYDLTYIFYDHEEVVAEKNGLGKLLKIRPDLIEADFAILGEPTNCNLEGGCNGTLRIVATFKGIAAHSARAWRGENAIHAAGALISKIAAYQPRTIEVDGLAYREGLNVVWVEGGIAKNSIPDRCDVTINYRFAPDKTAAQALHHVTGLLEEFPVEIYVDDLSEPARPGLDSPLTKEFIKLLENDGAQIAPKYGWTDVARFSALGIPAVNYAPGDPLLCHTDDENCPLEQLKRCLNVLNKWLRPGN
ncbi:succinyl-diaminopimelate desuccinylase [Actinomycetaceae bacterium TAE3-ERU4]|nr:succinyl-diaminopimelate desuccinylase [Actinomycetaceae bacterium TAE3-ERU4]